MKLLILTLLAAPLQAPDRITFVEVYGAERVGEAAVREALGMRDGDPMPTGPTGARQRLLALPGVAAVDLNNVCCAADGGALIYVGVAAEGERLRSYRSPPTGAVRLPPEVAALGADLERALLAAVQRGAIEEDDSEGHSLLSDPATRAVQRRMQEAVTAHADLLVRVLRESADEEQRALAAQIIAYSDDKRAIVPLLVDALDDPADPVRNNASRALGLIARHGARNPELGITVDAAPFIDMLTSHVWTDRNKAAAALMSLTDERDPSLLQRLRTDALGALAEMARWRHDGHALPAFMILGRIAGLDDAVSFAAFAAGERERVIEVATSASAPAPVAADTPERLPATLDRPVPPDSAALRNPPATEQWYFWTDDRVRHYAFDIGTAAAAGDTVIVLHGGWGAEHSYLVDAVAPLADRYRFVLYDQRGSLRSPAPDSTIRIDRLVADLEHLRASLGLERMTLLAHSMGNALAWAYLARYPERVHRLVLMAPVLPTPGGGLDEAFMREVWPGADTEALAAAVGEFMRDAALRTHAIALREGLIPDSLKSVPPLEIDLLGALRDRDRTRAWRISFAAVNTCNGSNWRDMRGGMIYYSQAAANAIMRDPAYPERAAAYWPALRSFPGPVRVLIGTCDFVDIGPAVWPRVVSRLRDGRIDVIDGAGHNMWLDRHAEFTRALERALGQE